MGSEAQGLGILTGLAAEARLARPLGIACAGGGSRAGAIAALATLLAQAGPLRGLLSFGLAGGLDPVLRPGDVVLPQAVLCDGRVYPTSPALLGPLAGAHRVALLADAAATVDTIAAKQALFVQSGAAAVDLESGPLAQMAARQGLPFAVLRVICDPATRAIPPAALAALDQQGVMRPGRVLAALLRHPAALPAQLVALLRLAADAAQAQKALQAAVAALLARPPEFVHPVA